MLYLRISQHFQNKPLFSETRTLPERHRHSGKGTEKERQLSKTYMLGSLIQGLYFQSKSLYVFVAAAIPPHLSGGASTVPGITALCLAGVSWKEVSGW